MQDQFLYLETTGWKTGRRHRIEIWFVEHNGRHYVMSEGGKHAHWVQNIMRNPQVSFSVAGRSIAGAAKVAETGPVASKVKKLMKGKYGWDSGLIVELAPS